MPEYMRWADVPTKERKHYRKSTFTATSCGCVIEYMWDDRTSEDDRLHLPFDTLHACERHKYLRDADNHEPLHEAVIGENLYFGNALRGILEALPEEHKNIELDDKGNEHAFFKDMPAFSFNANGELEVKLPKGMTAPMKKACADQAKAILARAEFDDPDYHPNAPKVAPFRNRKVHVK